MSKLGDVTFQGQSGNKYTFAAYPISQSFRSDLGGLYIFAQRYVENNKTWYKVLYIGETGSFGTRLPNHEKWEQAKRHGVNSICVLVDNNNTSRLNKETDLRHKYKNAVCNDQ